MAQYRKIAEERIVTRDQLGQGYIERDGLVIKKRQYEVIRELPDGTFLVRAPAEPGDGPPAEQSPPTDP